MLPYSIDMPLDDIKCQPVCLDGRPHRIPDGAFSGFLSRPRPQKKNSPAVPRKKRLHKLPVAFFHAENQIRLLQLLAADGPGPVGGYVDAVFLADLPGEFGGRFMVQTVYSHGRNGEIVSPRFLDFESKDAFGHGAAADIGRTNETDVCHALTVAC